MKAIIIIPVIIMIILILLFGLGRSPEPIIQPLLFNHKVHIVDQDMDCETCHAQVSIHARATLPSVKTCKKCHSQPLTNSTVESELLAYISKSAEIPWSRIYEVPDHVYFSHRRHVTLGNVKCETCHGNVQELAEPAEYPLVAVKMDNCMKCHEEHQITNDCLACHR
ncbi:MAG: cytochrome c3 family protein [Fidelibacterota bacterium]